MPAKFSVDLRFVRSVEALDVIIKEHRQRTALVLMVESVTDFEQRFLVSGLASCFVQNGVELFVLVGKESEQAHDALDYILEEAGMEDVVTSWHDEDEPEDVANFVAESARLNGLARLLVVVNESIKSGVRLKESITEAIRLASNV